MKPATIYLIGLAIAGCGPLAIPMAVRPDASKQDQIDQAWDRALDPVDKLPRQDWLDLFVGAQAYQSGVDKLLFRSEKNFSGGRVVMEIRYDRSRPLDDLFEVQVLDHAGKLLREEQFTREDVENTIHELFPWKMEAIEALDENEQREFAKQHEARWERIHSYFPDDKEEEAAIE